MQTNETTTENTHTADCRTNDTTNSGSVDWGCTCEWSDEDANWWHRVTD